MPCCERTTRHAIKRKDEVKVLKAIQVLKLNQKPREKQQTFTNVAIKKQLKSTGKQRTSVMSRWLHFQDQTALHQYGCSKQTGHSYYGTQAKQSEQ